MNYRAIAKKLLQEQPQTIAVLLARLPAQDAGEIVKLLPDFVQADLVQRIVHIERLPDEVLAEIDATLDALLRSR